MAKQGTYVVVLPYFCEEEIDRYLLTANWLKENCQLPMQCKFLLAASPKAEFSQRLYDAYSELGECIAFQCPTQVFGYPEGPTAMFWDAMDFIAERFGDQEGFSLWFESDMAFTQSDWVQRLANEWFEDNQEKPLLMGCFVPEVYKFRWLRKAKLILKPHINGGACYSLDFANRMPEEAREGVFDMAVYQYGCEIGGVKTTNQISFSTNKRVRRDLADQTKCVLHGFMQEKDEFIKQCVRPLTKREIKSAGWNPIIEKVEMARRRLKVCFFRHGHQAMFENMLLAKHRLETAKKVA